MQFSDGEELQALSLLDPLKIASFGGRVELLVNVAPSARDSVPRLDREDGEFFFLQFVTDDSVKSGLHGAGWNPEGLQEIGTNAESDYDSDEKDFDCFPG